MFIVYGGVFANTDFEEVIAGTAEVYGPFPTREEAETVWSSRSRANVDICCHRLLIREHDA